MQWSSGFLLEKVIKNVTFYNVAMKFVVFIKLNYVCLQLHICIIIIYNLL